MQGTADRCAPILRALPDWFGIEEATRQYIAEIDDRPTFIAEIAGTVVGFVTLTRHTPAAAEVHVMGVLPQHHHQGIGRALLQAAEAWLIAEGVAYLQVKTLSAAHPDPGYAATRAFYEGMGFRPLQEWPALWGTDNPCLQLVKALR
jgi:GNAT superfamily N-acetyltransferase